MKTWKFFFVTVFVMLLTTLAIAQSVAAGDLHVIVKDPKGSVLTNANVTATDEARGFRRSATGDAEGEYRILALPPGPYTVTVDAPGFAKFNANVTVTVGQMAEVPVTMSIAGTRETVEVTSAFGQNAYSRTSQQTYRDVTGLLQDTWVIGYNRETSSDSSFRGEDFSTTSPVPSFIQRTEKRYQATDNFSLAVGRHNTKFGVDFNYIPINATFTVNYGGVYDFGSQTLFPSLPSFSPVQAYGLGLPGDFIQGIGNPHDTFTNKAVGVFWQDSWRASSTLTLNYGLRYDIEFPPKFTPPDALALAVF
ncbi:MAG: hypothetical protein NVS1B11_35600 [Terriglobales bacterium]